MKNKAQIKAEIDAFTKGIKPDVFVKDYVN